MSPGLQPHHCVACHVSQAERDAAVSELHSETQRQLEASEASSARIRDLQQRLQARDAEAHEAEEGRARAEEQLRVTQRRMHDMERQALDAQQHLLDEQAKRLAHKVRMRSCIPALFSSACAPAAQQPP